MQAQSKLDEHSRNMKPSASATKNAPPMTMIDKNNTRAVRRVFSSNPQQEYEMADKKQRRRNGGPKQTTMRPYTNAIIVAGTPNT